MRCYIHMNGCEMYDKLTLPQSRRQQICHICLLSSLTDATISLVIYANYPEIRLLNKQYNLSIDAYYTGITPPPATDLKCPRDSGRWKKTPVYLSVPVSCQVWTACWGHRYHPHPVKCSMEWKWVVLCTGSQICFNFNSIQPQSNN